MVIERNFNEYLKMKLNIICTNECPAGPEEHYGVVMVGMFDVTSCWTEEGNILMIRSGGRFYYDIMLFRSIWPDVDNK